ncbi:hypothetical protein [Umezawaea sp. Da 62-37]|uniref:hypothetical protein n=1 Tax=Umezawaea sp. Da 62-37 TaxID=3075927 RepID=UPI0028F6C2CA|nr:hypothetical protein [Umezawaea sp. Da 62-37]WNV82251.1 hypothetical protein RM788_29035 [Umezawaea sp. Da 62-37]
MKIRLNQDIISLPTGLVIDVLDGIAEVWVPAGLAEFVSDDIPVDAEIIESVQQELLAGLRLA